MVNENADGDLPVELKKLKAKDTILDGKRFKEKIKVSFSDGRSVAVAGNESRELYNSSRYGTILPDGKLQFSLLETLYLIEKNKIELKDSKNKLLDFDAFLKKASKLEPNVWTRYCVFKDMRDRGYIIKTALKFGADFRVYDRGIKPGEDHARWIIYPVNESTAMNWYEFSGKNRVAHSTKKKLMMGIVDDEGDVTYYEIKWIKP